MTPLGSILKAARGRLGLSQDEVAQRAGIVSTTLTRLETGETPTPQAPTLARLAAVLSLDLESLVVAAAQPTTEQQESSQSAVDSVRTSQVPATKQVSDRDVNQEPDPSSPPVEHQSAPARESDQDAIREGAA